MDRSIMKSNIDREIRDLIDSGIAANLVMPADWITDAVIEQHPPISGDDADFYIRCAREYIRDTVQRVIREYGSRSGETSEQLKCKDFKHLQRAYLVERDGEPMIVPIQQCSNSELLAKIEEHRSMAAGYKKHADELYRHHKRP